MDQHPQTQPVERARVDPLPSLSSIKSGMTHAETDTIVRRSRPECLLNRRDSLGKGHTLSRYSLGDGTYLLLDYRNVADRMGNLGAKDKVTTIQILHFDDLKKLVPDDLFEAVRLVHLSPTLTRPRSSVR